MLGGPVGVGMGRRCWRARLVWLGLVFNPDALSFGTIAIAVHQRLGGIILAAKFSGVKRMVGDGGVILVVGIVVGGFAVSIDDVEQ